jgi:hypothetical protein
MEYITIGPHVWGKGATALEAILRMKQAHRTTNRRGTRLSFATYEVGPDTNVTELGDLNYPTNGPKPTLLREYSFGIR